MTFAFDTQPLINAIWGVDITYGRVGTVSSTGLTAGRYKGDAQEGMTSFGVYAIQVETYTISTGDLSFTPKLRDTITGADGILRVVTKVSGTDFLDFWALEAKYPSIASDLSQTATVSRPAPTPNSIGIRVPNLASVYTNQACRLQPVERTFDELANRLTTTQVYNCIFAGAVLVQAGDVIEVSGVKYEATGQQEIESLGLLTFAGCTRIDS